MNPHTRIYKNPSKMIGPAVEYYFLMDVIVVRIHDGERETSYSDWRYPN